MSRDMDFEDRAVAESGKKHRPPEEERREGERPRRPAGASERGRGVSGEGARRRPASDGTRGGRPRRRPPEEYRSGAGEGGRERRPEGAGDDYARCRRPDNRAVRRKTVPGDAFDADNPEDIDRLIEEKYREIEYLEAKSRRREARDGYPGDYPEAEERLERRRRAEESRRGFGSSSVPAENPGRKDADWEADMRAKNKRTGRRNSRSGGSGSNASRNSRQEEKPFFSEKIIKYIGGIIGIIIVLLVAFVVFGGDILSKVTGGGSDAGLASEKGVINILLVGQDGREDVEGSRSDSMMLVSVDRDTDKVKIISLMRDMYVSIPGHEDNRINAAYSFGGIDLLEQTVEQNFLVKIDGNVQIDFESFKTIIDKVNGVEIELSQEEADYLNTAYWQNGWTLSAGVQTLDGDQALAYSRIRQVGNSDFERTERQRKVLMTVFRKVKGQGKLSMLSLAKDIYPMLDTSIGLGDMITLGTTALGLEESNIETYRLPIDGGYENQTIRGMAVLVPNLEQNQNYLKELLFGSETE